MIIFLSGLIAGIILSTVAMILRVGGVLRVDNSDGDGPHLFLELEKDVYPVISKKFVVFKVKRENYLTQK